jgi:hypothetical protein
MHTPLPRHIAHAPPLPDPVGMPQERAARFAARRAFVDLKRTYLESLNSLLPDESEASARAHPTFWLRQQVVGAEEPLDLWLLRAPMFRALAGLHPEKRSQRQALRRALETLFPDSELEAATSAFASLY